MKYSPFNRHLMLEECEANEEAPISKVLVPDDYKAVKDFGTYRVVGKSMDCSPVFAVNSRVIVEESMVRSVSLGDKKIFIIPENFVVLYENE